MHQSWIKWAWCLIACLSLAGCGGDGQGDKDGDADEQADEFPTRAEVVVEPSQPTLYIEGEARASADVVRELLADESVVYPVSAVIKPDDAFEPRTRIRFWVEIGSVNGKIGKDSAKVLAKQTYDALAAAFDERARASLQEELKAAEAEAESAKAAVADLQQQVTAYQKSQQGLPATDESRKKRRYYSVMMENALERQIAAEDSVQKLRRRAERGNHATLNRIR